MNDARRVVLVTGAAGGIGYGTAKVLAGRGWHVLLNDLDPAATEQAAAELGATPLPGNVAEDAAGIIARAIALAGRLDGLVNNAGIIRRQKLAEMTAENFDTTMAVNLRAVMLLSAAALPHLEAVRGSIVNVASYTVNHPVPFSGTYSISKCGVEGFTHLAAVEWGPRGVRVNAIGPGMIRTPMAEASLSIPEVHEARRRLVPLGRIGTPEEAGRVIAFLLSDDAAYVSGQCIMVDGGQSWMLSSFIAHAPEHS